MDLNAIAQRVAKQLAEAGVGGNNRARFFGPARKGENHELRIQLNSGYADQRKEAIQRVLASHTDVSGLFPDVLKNMQTDDLEQKKLVYLYLMSYAKTQPELVILAVNTFVKDTEDPNPLIRALAIRTMGCLRADKIIDYLPDPLRKCLRDDNPYVRKTAAICVVKLYDLKPSLAIDHGFIDSLRDLVSDSNPMVVANAVTALSEIHEAAEQHDIFIIDQATLGKLLVALGECTEWGRIAILGAVAKYRTSDAKEAEQICERVLPQFQHSNAAVVLAAVKVIMIHMRLISDEAFLKSILRKMAPPLVTLVGLQPEVAWVALRNINLILQKRPDALSSEMRVFFCRYTDPAYVKIEKLDIMIRLAAEKNVDTLLSELKEYASEVDVDFVRRAIRAIGQTAIKIEAAAERCVHVLLELIATRVSYVVQEAVVVVKDIFRKYSGRFEGVLPTLCSNLDELDEPEAKASLIWMLGEYCDQLENADELLTGFLTTFTEEPYAVQLQTLTAIVKLFLKRPDVANDLVQRVLNVATKSVDNPDIRDRAYIYWRLLSTDAAAAKGVVLAARPPIALPVSSVSPALLDELIGEIATLASVYAKPAATFVGRGRLGADELQRKATEQAADVRERAIATVIAGQNAENLLDIGDDDAMAPTNGIGASTNDAFFSNPTTATAGASGSAAGGGTLDDLLGLFDSAGLGSNVTAPSQAFAAPSNGVTGFSNPAPAQPARPSQPQAAQDDLLGLF